MCVLGTLIAFLALFEFAVIYSSCFVGSYLVVRGISLAIGGFPNEFMIYDSFSLNGHMLQSPMLFCYLLAIVLMTVFSIQRQLRLRVDNMEEYAYKKYDFRYRRAGTMARSASQR